MIYFEGPNYGLIGILGDKKNTTCILLLLIIMPLKLTLALELNCKFLEVLIRSLNKVDEKNIQLAKFLKITSEIR